MTTAARAKTDKTADRLAAPIAAGSTPKNGLQAHKPDAAAGTVAPLAAGPAALAPGAPSAGTPDAGLLADLQRLWQRKPEAGTGAGPAETSTGRDRGTGTPTGTAAAGNSTGSPDGSTAGTPTPAATPGGSPISTGTGTAAAPDLQAALARLWQQTAKGIEPCT